MRLSERARPGAETFDKSQLTNFERSCCAWRIVTTVAKNRRLDACNIKCNN
jgi:hypothetical protein